MKRLTSHGVLICWLTGVWVALWGSLSAANVLGGLAVAAAVLLVLPLPDVPPEGGVRPVPLARFGAVFFWELVKASVTVVVQVLRPRASLRQAVIAVPVVAVSDQLLTVLANAVSLTPGTLALEIDRPNATLYVHVLNVEEDSVEDVRRSIIALERLAIRALGSRECQVALDESLRKERAR